jgi:hypothetical protein
MEKRLEGTPLIVHAVDLRIAELEDEADPEYEETLTLLRDLRERLLNTPAG